MSSCLFFGPFEGLQLYQASGSAGGHLTRRGGLYASPIPQQGKAVNLKSEERPQVLTFFADPVILSN